MFQFPDWCYRKLPSLAIFWLIAWFAWYAVLWYLSSGNPDINSGPKIPHFDKVVHFGYFMIGGFCLANFLTLKNTLSWKHIFIIVVLAGSILGAIDEYHQSFTPGRNGNDVGDWSADTLGTLAGCYYCFCMWRRIKKTI